MTFKSTYYSQHNQIVILSSYFTKEIRAIMMTASDETKQEVPETQQERPEGPKPYSIIDISDEELAIMMQLPAKKSISSKHKVKRENKKRQENVVDVPFDLPKVPEVAALSSSGCLHGTEALNVSTYSYQDLLQRIGNYLASSTKGDLTEEKRFTVPPPQVIYVGSKRTVWINFRETCDTLNRDIEHVFKFFVAELGTSCSRDGIQRMVIKGRFLFKNIESLLAKYIKTYVQCPTCRKFHTSLAKDPATRIEFVSCHRCNSSMSTIPIQVGFHAQTRADRRAMRNN